MLSRSRKTILKIGLILAATSTCLLMNHHKHKVIKQKYKTYMNEKFEKDLKINKFIFHQNFVKPLYDIKNQKRLEQILKEERIRKEKEKQITLSRGCNVEEELFILTFYTSLNCENGYGNSTCQGKKLRDGIAANNTLPLGTKIKLQGYGDIIIADRGGSNFNSRHRLDVFVPRNPGESDYRYLKRVNNMGVVKIKGYVIKK